MRVSVFFIVLLVALAWVLPTTLAQTVRKNETLQQQPVAQRDTQQQTIQVHARRLDTRFRVYANRLDAIIDRMGLLLEKFGDEGKDVAAAQAQLAEAKEQLAVANDYANLSLAKFKSIEANNYEGQRQHALQARDAAIKAREQYQLVLEILKEIIRSVNQGGSL